MRHNIITLGVKAVLKAMLLAGLSVAVVGSAQTGPPWGGAFVLQGDLLVGFTTGSGNDLIVNLGLSSSALVNSNQWDLSSVLSGFNSGSLSSVNWGVIGVSTGPARVYTTEAGGTPPLVNNASEYNVIKTAMSGLGGNINGSSGYGTPASSAAGDGSWYNGTFIGPSGTFKATYTNPNGSTASGLPSTLNFYGTTIGLSGTNQVLTGTFTIASNGILTFNTISSAPPPPVAGFSGVPTTGFAPLQVLFTDASTGSITNWLWDFGDGQTVTNTTNVSVNHTYAAAGSYTVTLTVAGPGGSNGSTQTGYVVASPTPTIGAVTRSGGSLAFSGSNCPAGVQYRILTSTNVALPVGSWQPVATNTFLGDGTFAYTNATANPAAFFRLVSP